MTINNNFRLPDDADQG